MRDGRREWVLLEMRVRRTLKGSYYEGWVDWISCMISDLLLASLHVRVCASTVFVYFVNIRFYRRTHAASWPLRLRCCHVFLSLSFVLTSHISKLRCCFQTSNARSKIYNSILTLRTTWIWFCLYSKTSRFYGYFPMPRHYFISYLTLSLSLFPILFSSSRAPAFAGAPGALGWGKSGLPPQATR